MKKNGNNGKSAGQAGGNLSFEEFARFFEKLSDDIVMDMLRGAHLLSSEEAAAYMSGKPYKSPWRRLSTRILIIVIIAEIFLLPVAVSKLYMSVSVNDNDPIQYSETADNVFCGDGHLTVNGIDVIVPADQNEKYSISYSWAAKDTQYPSVPHAANVLYEDEEGNKKYEFSLYRIESVPTASIPKGKTSENWFDDWKVSDEDGIHQGPLSTGRTKGFYITPIPAEEGESVSSYDTYSYYFATQDSSGMHIYVLEGICHNKDLTADFTQIMENGIRNITIPNTEV